MLEVAQEEPVSEDLGVVTVTGPCCLDKAMTCITRGWFGNRGGSGMGTGTGPPFSVMESHLALVVALLGDTGGGLVASSGM